MRETRFKAFKVKKGRKIPVTDCYAFDIYEAIDYLLGHKEAVKYKAIQVSEDQAEIELFGWDESEEKMYCFGRFLITKTNETKEYSDYHAMTDGEYFDSFYDDMWEDATRYFYQRIARHEKKGDAK